MMAFSKELQYYFKKCAGVFNVLEGVIESIDSFKH